MTKSSKLFRIIALAAIIQFSMAACSSLLPVILAQQGSGGSTQQPTTQQPTAQQATMDKLTFTQNRSNNPTAYNVAPANNSISGAVVIPSTYNGLPVTGIGRFSNVTGITSLVFLEGWTSLGQSTFRGCNGLTSVTIPASVQSIGAAVFSDCPNLTSITFMGSGVSLNSAFIQGDLYRKYPAGGAGIYTRTAGDGTWTRIGDAPITVNTSLNGVWVEIGGSGRIVTISGSTGTLNSVSDTRPVILDAITKGYWGLGSTHWRNLSSTGNLTWSGQWVVFTSNTSNPNVATGTRWINGTWALSANGQTLTVGNAEGSSTWTRR